MSKPKATRKTELLDMGSRALREYEEVARREYHRRIREDLIARGVIQAIRERSVEGVLEEAAPRFKQKGWRITERKEK